MRDLKKLGADLGKFQKRLLDNLKEAQKETAHKIENDVKAFAPMNGGKYFDSITTSNTEEMSEKIHTSVYTDIQTEDGYFLGRMIENGTGIYALEEHIGHTKTFIESGYEYWYVPADKVERPIGKKVVFNGKVFYVARGQRPAPHWKPALELNKVVYKNNIREAIRKAK